MEGRAKCDTSLGRPEQTNKTMDARSRAERVLNSGGRLSHRGKPWIVFRSAAGTSTIVVQPAVF